MQCAMQGYVATYRACPTESRAGLYVCDSDRCSERDIALAWTLVEPLYSEVGSKACAGRVTSVCTALPCSTVFSLPLRAAISHSCTPLLTLCTCAQPLHMVY